MNTSSGSPDGHLLLRHTIGLDSGEGINPPRSLFFGIVSLIRTHGRPGRRERETPALEAVPRLEECDVTHVSEADDGRRRFSLVVVAGLWMCPLDDIYGGDSVGAAWAVTRGPRRSGSRPR